MIVEESNLPPASERSGAHAMVTQLETRFSIVCDAIAKDKGHLNEAMQQFLQALGLALSGFRIEGAGASPLDVRVLQALDQMKPCRDYFLQVLTLSCESSHARKLHDELRAFLGQTIALKHVPRDDIYFNHLWCDHYRLFVRELYLCSIAILLHRGHFEQANRYIESEYAFQTPDGLVRCNFLKFDAYIKSLDEFRARRLRSKRLSIAADVLKERANAGIVRFDDVMQADFLLCVYGLLHYPTALTRWFPRTLVHAEAFENTGFDLFFRAQTPKHFAELATVLGVQDKRDLLNRFERSHAECRLDQWRFGSIPIPFASYMALAQLANT